MAHVLEGLPKLAGPVPAGPFSGVRLVEDLRDVAGSPAGSIVVLTAAASRQATSYRLDVTLRDAAAAQVAALVLTGPDGDVERSAAVLAERSGIGVYAAGGDLAALVVGLERAVAGDASDALARTAAAVRAILRAGGAPARITEAATTALGVPLPQESAHPYGEPSVEGMGGSYGGHLGTAVEIVTRFAELAAAVGPADEPAGRSRAQLLTELLVAPEKQAQELAPRARALGLPVDDWHVVLRLEPVLDEGPERYALLDAVAARAVRSAREIVGPEWNGALAGGALVVVRTLPRDQGRTGLREAVRDAARLLERVRPAGAELRCGVSTAHPGLLGLRTSASEARTALRRSPGTLAVYDLAGLDRMLEEWYASDAAHQAVRELLQPILDLKGDRPAHLIGILRAYLDHHGSPARAAEELHMHRNAVSRNIRRIEALLHADLDDPQQRLALQLACRAARPAL